MSRRVLFPLFSLGLLLGASECRKTDGEGPKDTADTSAGDDTGDSEPQVKPGPFSAVVWFETDTGERFPINGAEVTTESGLTATTDRWGAFFLDLQTPEQVCGAEPTYGHVKVCVTPEPGVTNDIVIVANERTVWGQVSGADGYPAVVSLPEFEMELDLVVSGEGFSVSANAGGFWVAGPETRPEALSYTTAKTNFEVGFEESGQADTLTNQRPYWVMAPTAASAAGLLRAEPGETVKLTAQAKDLDGDSVTVSWAYEGKVVATGDKAELTLSDSVGTHSVRVLAEDGRGGLRYASIRIQVGGAPMLRGQVNSEGAALQGASVTVDGVLQEVDEEGRFEMDADAGERHVLLVQHPEYLPHSEVIYGSSLALDIEMVQAEVLEFDPSKGWDVLPADKSFNLVIPADGVLNADGKPVSGQVALRYGYYSDALPGEPWSENEKGLLGHGQAERALYLAVYNPKDATEVYSLSPETQLKVYLEEGEKPATLNVLNPETGIWDSVEDVSIGEDDIICPFPGGGTGGGDPDPFAIVAWPSKVEDEVGCLRLHVPGNHRTPAFAVLDTTPPRVVRIDQGITVVRPLPPRTNVNISLWTSDPNNFGLVNQVDDADVNTGSSQLVALLPTGLASTADTCVDVLLREPVPGTFLTRYLADNSTVTDAYYAAVDPNSRADTFQHWLQSLDWDKTDANGFNPRLDTNDEALAIYGNAADLGFGREMHLRVWADWDLGSNGEEPIIAMYTTNYSDVHKAAVGLPADVDATVAMEFSPYPGDVDNYYVKFFAFAPDGTRIKEAPLDDFGLKAMPDLCVNCHGGVPASLSQINNTTNNGVYPTQGRMADNFGHMPRFIPYAVESFEYDATLPLAPQEADFKALNQALLLTNVSDDVRVMLHEWYDSTSYNDDAYPVSSSNVQDHAWYPGRDETGAGPFVGGDWRSDVDLYQKVVQPYCRSCHLSFDAVDFVNPAGGAGGFASVGLVGYYVCSASTEMPQAQVTQNNLLHDMDALAELDAYIGATCQP
ncbi:MAG: hypothetical protein ACI9VR_004880 [Cognaticolwellia sp.]|jgi:hypothetical protein